MGLLSYRSLILRSVLGGIIVGSMMAIPSFAQAVPPSSFADSAEKLLPTVVNISTTQRAETPEIAPNQPFTLPPGAPFEEFFDDFLKRFAPNRPRDVQSLGSGVIIDKEGYVVTNNHVVGKATEIRVILQDGEKFQAKLVGRDEKTDLALLKIEAGRPLPFAPWGDSEQARVGDWVMAIGNPFGLGGTVTAGIISARGRDINSGPYDDYIQTDASINRGNSGGPLFNTSGQIVGINTAIFTPTGASVGIGFAIPSNLGKWVLDQLRRYGKANRGWLGVRIQEVTPEISESLNLPSAKGALIAMVTQGQPAQKAGLKAGDVIVSFGGKTIDNMRDLQRVVAETSIDSSVAITVVRGGKRQNYRVTVGDLNAYEDDTVAQAPGDSPAQTSADVVTVEALGVQIALVNDAWRRRFGLRPQDQGVIVVNVRQDVEAFERGIRPGDVIVETGQKTVSTTKDVVDYVNDGRKRGLKFALFLIKKQGDLRFVTLSLANKDKP